MNYRSVTDLNQDIKKNLHKFPKDLSLIVGIPRSGQLAANLIALYLNLPLTDLDSFLNGCVYSSGRRHAGKTLDPFSGTILIVDDSIFSGSALNKAKEKLKQVEDKNYNLKFCCVYARPGSELLVDIHLALIEMPRIFEWNLWHHVFLQKACVDIDGVLCVDPTASQNDDGDRYLHFMKNAIPKHIPSVRLGTLVTSRLEKYRSQTEEWLKSAGVQYDKLVMLDLPDMQTRQKLGNHGTFKAEVYKNATESNLFIESEYGQAMKIFELTNKAVYCVETNELFGGDVPLSTQVRRKLGTQKNYLKSLIKKALFKNPMLKKALLR